MMMTGAAGSVPLSDKIALTRATVPVTFSRSFAAPLISTI
jgi:hypothetical protein